MLTDAQLKLIEKQLDRLHEVLESTDTSSDEWAWAAYQTEILHLALGGPKAASKLDRIFEDLETGDPQ